MKITIGADPELFAFSEYNGVAQPVHEWLPGDKKNPHKVNGGAVQVDGLAAEFNIDPADNAVDFDEHIKSVLNEIGKLKPMGITLKARPIAFFRGFNNIKKENLILGCDPDFDSDGNPLFDKNSQKVLDSTCMRTGSGHIHIGWGDNIIIDEQHLADCQFVSLLYENWIPHHPHFADEQRERWKHYGKPTAHRPKPYGVELRRPSNLWLNFLDDKKSYQWVFNRHLKMMEMVQDKKYSDEALIRYVPPQPKVFYEGLAA